MELYKVNVVVQKLGGKHRYLLCERLAESSPPSSSAMFEPAVLSKGHHAGTKQSVVAHDLNIMPIKCARIFVDENALQIQSDARRLHFRVLLSPRWLQA